MIHYFSLPGLSNCFLYLLELIGSTWTWDIKKNLFEKKHFSLFWFFKSQSLSVSVKSEGCEIIPHPVREHFCLFRRGWGGYLLQVKSQSFSAKGQGESAPNETRELHVCACVF